jgi:hypothetical protein
VKIFQDIADALTDMQQRLDVLEANAHLLGSKPPEKSVMITRSQFWEAFEWATSDSPHDTGWTLKDYVTAMANRLGLKHDGLVPMPSRLKRKLGLD